MDSPAERGDGARSVGDDVTAALYGCGYSIRTIAEATGRGPKAVRSALLRAGVTLRPPGAAPGPSAAAIAALPPGPAADLAATLLQGAAQSRAAARPWDPPAGPDAWERVLTDAVAQVGGVTVSDAATGHLGHRPTRAEAQAALRAARRLHTAGRLDLGQRKPTGGGRTQWTLSSPTTHLDTGHDAGETASTTRPDVEVEHLLRQLTALQESTLDPQLCTTATRVRLLAAVETTLAELEALRAQLDPTAADAAAGLPSRDRGAGQAGADA